jgi:hypothetical protein
VWIWGEGHAGTFNQFMDGLERLGELPEPIPVQRPLEPAHAYGRPEDLPARICTDCGEPLPDEIGTRPILTIGVVGTTGAGKSHYIAAAVYEAARRQSLIPWGYRFTLDATSAVAYEKTYGQLQRERGVLKPTRAAEAPDSRFRPLAARVTSKQGGDVTILLHDIAGEVLSDPRGRMQHATYLTRAAGRTCRWR